jgi:methyl-accepting chemotaxis protein
VAGGASRLLQELAPSIRKTADLVHEVAAASVEQGAGVGEISRAMAQVDGVTQRNASAAEELSATAQQMAAQAEALSSLISFFRVDGSTHEPLVTAAPPPSLPRAAGRGVEAGGDGAGAAMEPEFTRF